MSKPTLIRFSPLSGSIYALTRYRETEKTVMASEKFDVTLQAEEAVLQRKQWLRAKKRRAALEGRD